MWKIADKIATAAVTTTNSFEHELGRRRKTKQYTYCPFLFTSQDQIMIIFLQGMI